MPPRLMDVVMNGSKVYGIRCCDCEERWKKKRMMSTSKWMWESPVNKYMPCQHVHVEVLLNTTDRGIHWLKVT